MKLLTARKLIGTAALVLLLGLSVSSGALGQGRGHGHGGFDKKCGKFVNCHDARDGRWDGRGPQRNTFGTRHHWSQTRRHHDRWNQNGWNHNRHHDRWNRRH